MALVLPSLFILWVCLGHSVHFIITVKNSIVVGLFFTLSKFSRLYEMHPIQSLLLWNISVKFELNIGSTHQCSWRVFTCNPEYNTLNYQKSNHWMSTSSMQLKNRYFHLPQGFSIFTPLLISPLYTDRDISYTITLICYWLFMLQRLVDILY